MQLTSRLAIVFHKPFYKMLSVDLLCFDTPVVPLIQKSLFIFTCHASLIDNSFNPSLSCSVISTSRFSLCKYNLQNCARNAQSFLAMFCFTFSEFAKKVSKLEKFRHLGFTTFYHTVIRY